MPAKFKQATRVDGLAGACCATTDKAFTLIERGNYADGDRN